jgi:hypothetical protein
MNRLFSRKIFYCCMLLSAFAFTLKSGDQSFSWSEKQLTWDDFRGKPHTKSRVGAITYSGIKYSYEQSGSSLSMKVVATFDPDLSWYNKSTANEYVLRHEQLHFDITELYARKLRAALKQISPKAAKPSAIAEKLYDKFFSESRDYQDLYDHETNHSRNEARQAEWDKKISSALKELQPHADTFIFISFPNPSRN